MKPSVRTSLTYLAALMLSFLALSSPCYARSIKFNAEFQGTIPGSDIYGDAYGWTLSVYKNDFVVGAPYAAPDDEQISGAVYFYRKNHLGQWLPSQPPFVIPFAYNYISYSRLVTRGDWLFVPVIGTPTDNSVTKDFSGSVYVFKKSKGHLWNQVQIITNPVGPIVGNNTGFGTYLDTDGEKWLVISGYNENSAYFYKLNKQTQTWDPAQTVTVPENLGTGEIFVAINNEGKHAMLGFSNFNQPENGYVFAYKLKDNVWTYIQTLEGVSPAPNTTFYGLGDAFGNFISIHHHWAAIGSPTDSTIDNLAGSAYFYQYDEKKEVWRRKQKVFSDLPSVFFGSAVGIKHDIIIVSDPGRPFIFPDGSKNLFQGAAAVWRKQPVCWEEKEKSWFHVETLFDPNGRAYDFLGAAGLDIHDDHVGLGTQPTEDSFLPNGFPGKRNYTDPVQPVNDGRALLYRIRHCCR